MTAESIYRGRFAPSPTGPLHFGSLLAALASALDARAAGGQWYLRIEDLDRERTLPAAADDILRTLDALGFCWDGPVLYQRTRGEAHREALGRLQREGWCYPCACSRSEVAAHSHIGIEGPIYPGTCRAGLPAGRSPRSHRLRTEGVQMHLTDRIQGPFDQDLAGAIGDFVLWRADDTAAYQLAVVVDDAFQGITEVVRGADLLLSTPRQVFLQRLLDLPTPGYAHIPVAVDDSGRKLSKSDGALPIDRNRPVQSLDRAWRLLGQTWEDESPGTVDEFWSEAIRRWDLRRVPQRLQITVQTTEPTPMI